MNYKIDFEHIDWEEPIEGMRQKVHDLGEKQIRLVEYSPKMVQHWCEKGHTGYVIEGKLEIRFEDQVQIFSSGAGIIIPSGRKHRHVGRALTDKVLVYFIE